MAMSLMRCKATSSSLFCRASQKAELPQGHGKGDPQQHERQIQYMGGNTDKEPPQTNPLRRRIRRIDGKACDCHGRPHFL
jgi:hypothetical protein